ncbi:MAG: electron transfer flavoprotein subunit beta/FixA family protein [Gemmatimonadales bacterium]|nr:electron transfer flavoprotein subunit beta/FixA family protein [Gemmatimonadales bacterium]
MKIAVCIKRVADSEARVKIAADGKRLDEAGVKFGINPYDEFAVEEALRRKETAGAGEVVVFSLGPAAAQETIRTALAMGADRGILLQTDAVPADGFETAKALAAELKDGGGGWDLILFGKMAIDDYNHQVGPMVAELLGLPCVTAVAHLEIDGAKGVAEREIEGGIEVVEFPLPAVITADKGLNEPRYPALKGIMAAKRKPLETKPVQLGAGSVEILSLALPPDRKEGKIVGEGAAAVPELVRLLREEAKVL